MEKVAARYKLLRGDFIPADSAIALTIAAGGPASHYSGTLAIADVSGDRHVTSLDAILSMQAATEVADSS
ncbi:MAG: hypothetical protein U9Q37_07850 [Euryarchaeota archaeon]|nr:hypothetical protein [Euryarchaeota archaeon]